MRPIRGLFLPVLAMLFVVSPADAQISAGAYARYWDFSDGRTIRDYIAFLDPGPLHLQVEYWDFSRGEDQFRPEVGVRLRDRRRSSYEFTWRHELDVERLTVSTGQVVGAAQVLRLGTSLLVSDSNTDVVAEVGLDHYWGDYSLAGVTLVRDPRDGGLFAVPMRVRLASARNHWIQGTLSPASGRTMGWAVDAKWAWVRVGVERNSRFDFTELDNTIFTLGFQHRWDGDRR